MPDRRLAIDVANTRGPERRGWHFDKTMSAIDLVIVVTTIVGGLFAFTNVKQDVAVQAAMIQNQDKQRAEDRQATEAKFAELNSRLGRMEDKLEKIADKVGAQR